MKVGYMRVSTEDQNLARQQAMMSEWGVEKIFADKLSGKDTSRDGLLALLEFVREGDVVHIESYSRISRNCHDLFSLVTEFEKRGVGLVSKKENCDTTTPAGRLIFTVFAGLVQFEREQTLERTREGVKIAKEQGKYKGRKKIEIDWREFENVCKTWKQGEITAVEAMSKLRLKPNTFYRRVNEFEEIN